jgi:hypothetical protein
VVGQHADDLDVAARQADFFLGFAQGGFDRRGVQLFGAAARKADLAGVVVQVGGALGQQDRQAVRGAGRWASGRRRGAASGSARASLPAARAPRRGTRQALAQPGRLQALGRQRGLAGDRIDGQALGIEMQFCQKTSPEKKKASVRMPFPCY